MGCIMGRCINCEIEILDDVETCPLCRSVLLPTDETENAYPNVRPHLRDMALKLNMYLFIAPLLWLGVVFYNIQTGINCHCSIGAGVVMVYIYMIWHRAVSGRASYRNKVLVISFISALLLVGIDLSLDFEGWSISWVLPGGLLIAVFVIVYCMCRDQRSWQSYISGQLWTIIFSFLVWGGCHWTGKEQHLAVLDILLSLIFFWGSIAVGGHRAYAELKRRFHTH